MLSNPSLRVALWCRVSTKDQNCERQEQDLTGLAQRAGWTVVGVWKEVRSGAKATSSPERRKVMDLAQARQIDAVVVTELTRWGRSTIDLISTLQDLEQWGVSLIAQTGLQLDLNTAQGKLFATLMAGLAEFERDLLRERTRSGMAAARVRGSKIGRPARTSKRVELATPRVLELVNQGVAYRTIARELKIGKSTIQRIVDAGEVSRAKPGRRKKDER